MKSFSVNWKTTGAGIGAIATALIAAWQSKTLNGEVIAAVIAGLGLIFAKDGNVTGGTKPQ